VQKPRAKDTASTHS